MIVRVSCLRGSRVASIVEETEHRVRVRFHDNGRTLWVARGRVREETQRRAAPKRAAMTDALVGFSAGRTTAVPKRAKPKRDRDYLAFVRTRQCIARWSYAVTLVGDPCAGPCEAHHFGPRGVGQKADDDTAVALCAGHHRYFHDHGTLPGMTREQTEAAIAKEQQRLRSIWAKAYEGRSKKR